MIVGYARTSTLDQEAGLEAQVRDLMVIGIEKMFTEQVSSVKDRPELERAIEVVREGDVLVVTKLDRLARSMCDLMDITRRLEAKGVALRILAMNLDTSTPTGKLMRTVLGGVAEFERDMMLERQREGIAKAKAEGKYKGRAPTARRQLEKIQKLRANGVPVKDIAEQCGIAQSSVFRLLRAA